MMVRKKKPALWLLLVFASACSALNADNPAATLQAQREGYIVEATSIAEAAQSQGTQVAATVAAAQTYIAEGEGRNQQLLATMRAVLPPTQQIVSNDGPVTPGLAATSAPAGAVIEGGTPSSSGSLGSMLFTQVGTASSVRSSDDCAENLTTSFPASASIIYMTTRALNVEAGTVMRVEWNYQGQLSSSESWTVPRDDDDFCLWLSLEPSTGAFAQGNWSVSLYANNVPVDPPIVNFVVGDAMTDG